MDKFVASLQLLGGAILGFFTIATVINVVLIVSNQENSISVVNVMVGQGVLIVCLAALTRILFRKGLAGFRQSRPGESSPEAGESPGQGG